MAGWSIVADTSLSNSSGLKVVLKKGDPEIFKTSEAIPRLAAQTTTLIDQKNNALEVGYWNQKGDWVAIANFSGGSWLYVRPL
jgi:hypothetical protein